jgi:hypothetical protein
VRSKDGLAVGLFVLLLALTFAPWWAGGSVFAPMDTLYELYEPWAEGDREVEVHNHFTVDAVLQYIGYREIAARSFEDDGFIGWNDLIHGGNPAYANTMAAFGDWSMWLHRFLDFWTAWHLGLGGQFLIAGLGMFVFLRSRSIGPAIALVGAIAFAANTQFIVWVYHRFQLGSFCWAPWILWAMYAFRDGRQWAWPLVPVFTALAFLGGNLQTNVFVVLLLGSVWVSWAWERRGDRGELLEASYSIGLWTVFGLGLAAFQILPTTAGFFESAGPHLLGETEFQGESITRGRFGYRGGLIEPFLSVVFFFGQMFPSLFGGPQSVDLSKALGRNLFDIAFFGFLPMIVAIRVLLLKEAPAAARSLVVIGAMIPLTPLVGPLYHRVQLLFVLGGIWAFAWYWENYHDEREQALYRWLSRALAILAGLWLVLSVVGLLREEWLLTLVQNELMARMAQGEGHFRAFEDWVLLRAERLVTGLRIWHIGQLIPLAAAFMGLTAMRLRFGRLARYALPLLLAAVIAELTTFGVKWVTVSDAEKYPFYAETSDISTLRRLVGSGRVYVAELPDRPGLLPSNTLSMYGVATIQQYETIVPPSMWQKAGLRTDARTLGQLAVTHAVTYADAEMDSNGWTLQYHGDHLSLWENEHVTPRYLALPDHDSLISVEGASSDQVSTDPAILPPVRLISATFNRRHIEAPAGTSLVRVAENWSEGWQFRVGGTNWSPVSRGPDWSIVIDLGDQITSNAEIEMRYRPQRRALGRWLSACSLAALLLFTGYRYRSLMITDDRGYEHERKH